MKKYYTVAELLDVDIPISRILHALLHTKNSKAFVYLTNREHPKLHRVGAYAEIPNAELQLIEANFNKGNDCSNIELQIYRISTPDDIWTRYLNAFDNEYIDKNITEESLKEFEEYEDWMPDYFKDLKPCERFRMDKAVIVDTVVHVKNLCIKSNDPALKSKMLNDPLFQKYPFLKKGHPEYSKALRVALDAKKALHIDKSKSKDKGYEAQVKEFVDSKPHNFSDNMIKSMSFITNSDSD